MITRFCGQEHDRKDGKPIRHRCYVLPVRALGREKEGDYETALRIIERAQPLRSHKGKVEYAERQTRPG